MGGLFRSLVINGILLLKYLEVLQEGSLYFLGWRVLWVGLLLKGNISACLGDLVHFKAKV